MGLRLFDANIDLNKNQLLNAVIQVLGSAPGSPSQGQIYYSSADTTFYGWNGTTWLNLGNAGSGSTDLTFSRDGTTVTIISSTGADAVLPASTTSLSGVMSAADKTKLDGIASGAQVNVGTDLTVTATLFSVDILSSTGTDVTLNTAVAGVTAGIMTSADKAKLDGIATSANNYTHPNHSGDVTSTGDGATLIANDAVTNAKLANVATATIKGRVTAATGNPEDLTAAQVRTLLNVADGAQVNVATNISEGTRTSTTVPVLSSTGTGASLSTATTSLAGVMSSADKTKLDGIETGATADQNAAEVPFDNTATGFAATTVQAAINEAKVYSDNLVIGGIINKGGYNASTNTPDLDTTPIGGIKNGWSYVVTAAGTFFSEGVQIGDMIIAKQDTPTTLAHWTIVNKNIPDIINASETDAGLVEEATAAEIIAGTNTGATGAKLFITPGKLQTYLNIATAGLSSAVKYITTVGDNSATTITVTHNIGKQFNTVQVFQTGSPFAQIECEVRATSTTQTTFIFNTAPTSNQYTVVITG